MKFGTNGVVVYFDSDFVEELDKWKKLIIEEGIKGRLKTLIQKDLKAMEHSKN